MPTLETREFQVALCGFSDTEKKALQRAFMLSEVRPRRYLHWSPGPTCPHICILNEDLPVGPQHWNKVRRKFPEANLPVVRIGVSAKAENLFEGVLNVFFKRPILANRILRTLDELVTDCYQFAPELAISDDMPEDVIAEQGRGGIKAADASGKRILVVDDSASVRRIMEVRLAKGGYEVDFAETGEEALAKAGEEMYDLIFLDVMLPGMSGYDVSRALKRQLQIETPVVMLTGKTSRIDKLRGSLASADAYLTKPLTLEHLNETLQRYLG